MTFALLLLMVPFVDAIFLGGLMAYTLGMHTATPVCRVLSISWWACAFHCVGCTWRSTLALAIGVSVLSFTHPQWALLFPEGSRGPSSGSAAEGGSKASASQIELRNITCKSVPDLKAMLEDLGLPSDGNKDALLKRIRQAAKPGPEQGPSEAIPLVPAVSVTAEELDKRVAALPESQRDRMVGAWLRGQGGGDLDT